MPRFEIETPQGRFEVEAPDMDTAVRALQGGMSQQAPESQQSQTLRSELSAMTQNPAKAAYDRLPEWQKPMVAAKDILDLTANGATFGFGDKAVAAVRAPFTDKSYEEELADQRRQTQGARRRSGGAGLVAEVAGGVRVPMSLANRGATLAGRFGTAGMEGLKGLGARTGLMAAEGAGYGALTAAGNDQDIGTGAAMGAAGGALGNLAGEAISAGVYKAAGAFNKKPPRMTAEELKTAAREAYKKAEDAGVVFTPTGVSQLQRGIVDDFTNFGFHPANEPGAATVLREMQKLSGKNVTLKGLDTIRKIASNGFQPGNQSNNALLTQAIKRIDDFVENAGGDAVMMGSNAKSAGKIIADARKLWGRASKLERAEQLVDKAGRRAAASGSGGNVENATRQNVNRMLDNPRLSRGMTPDELAAARKVVEGTTTQNVLRQVGKLSPQGNGLMQALGVGGVMAQPAIAVPTLIAGYGAKKASEMLAQRSVDDLVNLIAQGGNASSLKVVENAVQLLSKAKREALSRALMSIGVNRSVAAAQQPAN